MLMLLFKLSILCRPQLSDLRHLVLLHNKSYMRRQVNVTYANTVYACIYIYVYAHLFYICIRYTYNMQMQLHMSMQTAGQQPERVDVGT